MQSFKRFRKQLAFLLLIGSAVFSASSSNAQDVSRTVFVNTDVIIDPAVLINLFPTATQLAVVQIGGIVRIDDSGVGVVDIDSTGVYDPFATNYLNNRPVGGSQFQVTPSTNQISGLFTEKPGQPLLLDLYSGGTNSPAYNNDGTNCKVSRCVALHYGYYQTINSNTELNPSFLRSLIELRDPRNPNTSRLRQYTMVSPKLTIVSPRLSAVTQLLAVTQGLSSAVTQLSKLTPISTVTQLSQVTPISAVSQRISSAVTQGFSSAVTQLSQLTPTEYYTVYSEYTDPQRPQVTTTNWTQFPVKRGETPILSFTNSSSDNSVRISNARALRSTTQIPLAQLNSINLPPTIRNFQAVPSANVTLSRSTLSGITTTPAVNLNFLTAVNANLVLQNQNQIPSLNQNQIRNFNQNQTLPTINRSR
ncbi:hypothetical protein [Nostoc sphaeroides]|uniref:Uncharacterized protein n=1 Tax=Nostoc sphaeroides CCNUC1 TaxID=2653204 RepID=A0A5P8VZJ7_9NOSO|nr:hypothetical protein [Nostoc sphaeroides]QFS45868.1 hypothetical protein GXM_03347 [Nostoc sphaeroides CCNUC1]